MDYDVKLSRRGKPLEKPGFFQEILEDNMM